ncbi:MAG TPA: hypothetical protein VGQ36_18290 [Thermoanaerobaculia bacterium]|jgi:hypothetical protein|nr:hypothetical protein [Thermoanaerobaculia bacterium]
MKRFAGLLSLSLFIAAPIFARVISYAPYTNRVAIPSTQDRASRHFVLIEAKPEQFLNRSNREIVLYDSTGVDEPQVITPVPGVWEQAALYQKDGGAPMILVLRPGGVMVNDGGKNWRLVQGLGSIELEPTRDVDSGGPFANGLFAPIVLGNDDWPFVVSLRYGVWAISRTGEPRLLKQGARVVGRNAAGDRFLVQSGMKIWTVTLDGTLTHTADLVGYDGPCAGWITADGTAYLEHLVRSGRTLYIARDGSLETLTSGPYAYAPSNEDPVPLRVFAVPTHDYEGTWIVERAPNMPTTLSRHTPASGLQVMWSDDAGPQVEALIAGASGNTVLVQVHRDRKSAQLSRPIIDPALAVWRVGQPAPRTYDELYLNEQWNKGFVIVDADRIESGTFVFNSGFKEIVPSVSRVSAPIGGGGDVIQEWGVVRGSFKQRLVLPGVARLRGAYDSFWQTDVTVYNPLAETQRVDMRYVPLGVEQSLSTTLTLQPYEIRAIPDVLRSLFLLDSGGGTLHLLPDAGINATARTYTKRGQGTFGFGMNAIDFLNASGPRFPLSFSGAFQGANFRTNVLLTDTSGRGTHANLRTIRPSVADESAGSLGTTAAGTVQSTVVPPATLQNEGVALVVEPTRGTAIATVVAIDNRSNDPTWFPPDIPGTVPRAIPVIGHLEGANGAQFRTDLILHNPRPGSRYLVLTARLWDAPDRQYVQWVYLQGRETRIVRDVLKTLFGLTGVARLRYASAESEPGEGVRVTSRTYSVAANGATYGCLVPPLNGFQIGTLGDRLEILGASAGAGFRTNVGIVDLADDTVVDPIVRITIVGNGQQVLDTRIVTVPARGGIQINDIFRSRGITPPPAALLVVEVIGGQQIAAYATLTDNVTNDPIYLTSQLGAKETN